MQAGSIPPKKRTRREMLLAVVCASALTPQRPLAISPATFPWSVDREGHIGRRIVAQPRSDDATEPVIDLMPLHAALGFYMSAPGNPERIAHVRHHLLLVHAATADGALPFPWREMHYGCALLLKARQWHPVFD